jgi:hypothetical protein
MARVIDLRAASARSRTGFDFRARVKLGLLTGAAFGNAGWTASTNVARFMGPWQFARLEPGVSLNVPAISNSNQQPNYDTRHDVGIRGSTHFSPVSTSIVGSIQANGGRRLTFSGADIGGATGGKLQLLKAAQAIMVEGIVGDFASNPTDQDGLVVGGCAAARLTASINGFYMTVTGRTNVPGAASTGDLIIGGTLTNGTGVTVGTRVVDFGKCRAIGSISGTTMTTTQEVGAPIAAGMTVEVDGGVVVGTVSSGSTGSWTITNSAGVSVPAGSRIFIESKGQNGSYLLDTSQTVASTAIDFYPPTPGYFGVPQDIPTDRIAEVALNYGPIIYRQLNRILNTHGTNLCKTIAATNAAAALNSAPLTSVTMTGAQTCQVVLAGTIAGLNPRGAWATATAYAQGDAVSQGGKVYFCAQAHTSGTFTTDLTTNTYWVDPTAIGGGNQNAATMKLANVGYNSQNLPIGYFSRDWHVTNITLGTGGAGTTIDLVCDNTYTGNLPPNGATGDVATYGAIIILMGMPPDASKANYLGAKQPGEHADSMGQTDKEKQIGFLGTDLVTGTSSYQAGGITSNSANNDTTEEFSRDNLKWVLGLIPGEDPVCNIAWTGMQQVVVGKKKRWWQCYADVGPRTWVSPDKAPFPNATLRPTATEAATGFKTASGIDGATSFNYLAYGGQIFSGGWLFGSPATDFCPAGVAGFSFSMASPRSYYGQRDPSASEMLSLSFQHDTVDTLSTASAGTHIGWFDLTCTANFPGALANGNRCLVDAIPDQKFVGLGTSVTGRRATRGRQAIPIGNNPVYIDCPVVGTAITKRFGPYNFPGAPAAATTTLAIAAQPVTAPINTGTTAARTFTAHPIGTAAADRYVFVCAIIESSAGTPRGINAVSVGGIAASLVTYSYAQKSDGGTVAIGWYRALVTTGTTADIVVTASGSNSAAMVYVWAVNGLGTVYDSSAVVGATGQANVGLSTNIATPVGGAVLAVHTYASAASGVDRRASAMNWTGYTPSQSQAIGGTVSGTDLAWTVGTEVTSSDIAVIAGGTGAATLTAISLSPAFALEANMIGGTLSNGNVIQAGSVSYVDATGLVQTAAQRTNKLLWSEAFEQANWSKTNSTITADATTAPNGTATADTWARLSTASASISQGAAGPANSPWSASYYVKMKTGRYFAMRLQGIYPSRADVVFDLQNGVISTAANSTSAFSGASATMTPVGNGWYRCTLTATGDAQAGVSLWASFNSNGTVTDGTDSSATSDGYLWGAQLEQAANASGYIPTTTAAVTNSLPRFDYNLGILRGMYVEPSRTNLSIYSETTGNATEWVPQAATFTSTNNADPFGRTTGGLVAADGSNGPHFVRVSGGATISFTSGLTYAFSYFVKAGSQSLVQLTPPGAAFPANPYANFDLASGTVTLQVGCTADIRPVANGWYRISIVATAGATTPANGAVVAWITAGNSGRIAANTLTTNFYITGGQTEQAGDVSSYIPTAAAAVTRAADTLNLTGIGKANGTYTARCWHVSGDYTDVAGVTVTSGAATLSAVSTKPIQGVTFL